MTIYKLSLAALLVLAGSACGGATPLPCAEQNVCFTDHVVPRLQRDCVRCHDKGQDGIKVVGDSSDYDELMRYVVAGDSAHSELLDWAAGKDKHQCNWPRGGEDYNCVARWIDEGANSECVDPETLDAGSDDAL